MNDTNAGILIWEFACPACETIEYREVPLDDDTITCTTCDWAGELAVVNPDE